MNVEDIQQNLFVQSSADKTLLHNRVGVGCPHIAEDKLHIFEDLFKI